MTQRKDRLYPHITGVRGDEGENPGVLAVHAILDPSEHFPEDARIIVGSPSKSPQLEGYIPNLGGFCTGVEGAESIISTLQQAVSDIRHATGQRPATFWGGSDTLRGYDRIGRIDATGRRSLWLRENGNDSFDLRAGREGEDQHVEVTRDNPQFDALYGVMAAARFAAEHEDANGLALSPMGIERHGYEDAEDVVTDWSGRGTTVILFTVVDPSRWPEPERFRVIVRYGSHFAVQHRVSEPDVVGETMFHWEPATESGCGMCADALLSLVMVRLCSSWPGGVRADNNVSIVEVGLLRPPSRPT